MRAEPRTATIHLSSKHFSKKSPPWVMLPAGKIKVGAASCTRINFFVTYVLTTCYKHTILERSAQEPRMSIE